MHDELHPLRGTQAVHVVEHEVSCRFPHAGHDHAVRLYPETWVLQVRWQHAVPDKAGLAELGLPPAALVFEAETCWYTLHDMGGPVFERGWERLEGDEWVPLGIVCREPVERSATDGRIRGGVQTPQDR